jgi:glycosyltransferase involved in cell wall biosynthesis
MLAESRIDALLTLYGGNYSMLAYLSGFRPYAVYLVGSDVHMLSRFTRLLTRIALSGASTVLANGKHLAAVAAERMTRKPVLISYIGVDTRKFAPVSVPSARLSIVCTRGFEPVYNNEAIIEALAELGSLNRDFDVVFVSSGSLLPRARARAEELFGKGSRCQVSFLGGADDDSVVRSLREAEVYVSMSRSDGTSVSLLEALSCGLFPILSDIPANRDWVDPDAGNGILVPLDDTRALARAITTAVNDDSLRARAREFNRALALRRADALRSTEELAGRLAVMSNQASFVASAAVST